MYIGARNTSRDLARVCVSVCAVYPRGERAAPPLASRPRREETVAAGRRGEWTCAPIWAALGPKPWSAPQTLSNNVTFERRPLPPHHMPSVMRVHMRAMFYGTNNHIGDVRFPLALPTLITVTLSEHDCVVCVWEISD